MEKPFDYLADLGLWLSGIIKEGQFDLVVSVERKATALLRALIEMVEGPMRGLAWSRVVSSDAVGYPGRNFWEGKRILVFNELMHTGSSTDKVVTKLLSRGVLTEAIRTAAYGTHMELESTEKTAFPSFVRYRCLDKVSYPSLLAHLVEALHKNGGLLLDTEHLELPVTLHCPVNDFLKALRLCGNGVRFNAYDAHWADCMTLTDILLLDEAATRAALPEGASIETASDTSICKLRVVPRGYGQYAVVPIWYPAVRKRDLLRWGDGNGTPTFVRDALASYNGEEGKDCEERAHFAFSLVTLVASIELLKSAVAAIHSLGEGAVTIGFPPRGEIPPHVGHLGAVYPTVELPSLAAELGRLVNWYSLPQRTKLKALRGETVDAARQRFDPKAGVPRIPPAVCVDMRNRFSRRLLEHQDAFDRWTRDVASLQGLDPRFPETRHLRFLWKEMMGLAGEVGVEADRRAAVMDLVIDDGTLVTSYTDREDYMRRTYSFAAEEVCRKLRNERMAVGM